MNWTKFISIFAPALLCTLPFLASSAWAEEPVLDVKGLLTIGEGDPIKLNNEKLADLIADLVAEPNEKDEATTIMGIKIEEEGTLEIASGTEVALGGSYISVSGKLIIDNNSATKIYGFTEKDGEKTPQTMRLDLNGGTIQIRQGTAESDSDAVRDLILDADVNLGTEGGTMDIAADEILKIGKITGGTTGNLALTSGGTLQVGAVSMGGNLDVQIKELQLLDGAKVGKLDTAADTIINGARGEDEENSNLTTLKGGTIKGELKNIGYLLTGDGSSVSTLTFEGGSHDVDSIGIQRNATVELQAGTSIKLTNTPEAVETTEEAENGEEEEEETAANTYDDIIIEGTLKVSSGVGTGIYKGNLENLELENVYLTVSGNTNSDGEVINGVVEIVKSNSEDEEETLIADTLHTEILSLGKISVAKNVVFQSGSVQFGTGGQAKLTGAHLFVDGGGTYKAGKVDLGTGYLLVQGEGTKMEFLETVKAGALISDAKTNIVANGDVTFGGINHAGNYDANHNDLTIEQGGQIAGHIQNVDNLKLGGDLLLQVNTENVNIEGVNTETSEMNTSESDPPIPPILSADTLEFTDATKSHVRITGLTSGNYSFTNIIKITDSESQDALVDVLNNSQSALNKTVWTPNEDGTFNAQVSIMGVDEYVRSEWKRSGGNVNNVAALLENISRNNVNFGNYVQNLSPMQIQNMIRSAATGELVGSAARIALQQPASSIFRHLDTTVPLRFPFTNSRGQVREGFNVWFNPYGQSEKAESDGTTLDGYDMTRFGFHVGGDIELYNRALLGVLFGYANPHVKSELGRITADEFTAGMYLRVPTAWAVVANILVGFGNQDYTYDHLRYDSEYRGSSFFASAELTRPVDFQVYQLTPLVALDFQSAEMDGFLADLDYGVYVQPEDASQAALRFGLLGNFGRFRTRLQYTRQIAGDDFVSTKTWVLSSGIYTPTTVRGTQWGKDWINVGVGGELLQTRFWRLFADYNFDLGKHTTSHLGSLNAVLTW